MFSLFLFLFFLRQAHESVEANCMFRMDRGGHECDFVTLMDTSVCGGICVCVCGRGGVFQR